MFDEQSRYAGLESYATTDANGRPIRMIKLRRLPATAGAPQLLNDRDRLDLLSYQRYADGTRYWHIADANASLAAAWELTARRPDPTNLPER